MPRLLALPPIGDLEDAGPTVFCGCAPFRKRPVQPAGQAFFDTFERSDSLDGNVKEEAAREDRSGSDEDSPSKDSPSKPKKKKEKKEREEALKLPECLKGEDIYALLEVEAGASQEDLKKAFRKICLTHHPDKHSDKSGAELEAVNEHFVKLQEAFNVLSDVKKRRKYDSMGEFDDWVPTKLKDGQDFFEVFDPVFKRNAKWSEQKPVPELGDLDAPYEKVKAFYDFWFDFQSWRDLDELIMEEQGEDCFQDLEEAECRDEKRWMERENARLRGKYQKVERQRIFGFVELAERLDPRVRAEKERQLAAKEAAKNAKEAKRLELERLEREEAERKAAEEEKKRIAQMEERAKREEEKQVRKVARAKLRKVVKDLNLGLAEESLQDFLLVLDPAETDQLTGQIEAGDKGEAVLGVMKAKGVEPIFVKCTEDEKSTEEGSPSEEEDPQEKARLQKERLAKQKELEKRRKQEEAEAAKLAEEEAAKRAEEKLVRDAKKKVEQEKKDREQQKAAKKEAERLKREEEKRVKEEAKLAEQAKKEKESNKKQSEELRQKQKAEKEAEDQARQLEIRTMEFERDRLARCDAFDKLSWPAVIEAAQVAVGNPIVASGLAAAAAEYEDAEELLDAQLACLGSFFALGKRPEENSLALSSGLRSRVKKLRGKIRAAAAAGDFTLSPAEDTEADAEALQQILAAANGEAPFPVAPGTEEPAAAVAEEAPAKAGKKKAKAKAAAVDEDLDSLLAEFDMQPSGEKKSKKSGKKK